MTTIPCPINSGQDMTSLADSIECLVKIYFMTMLFTMTSVIFATEAGSIFNRTPASGLDTKLERADKFAVEGAVHGIGDKDMNSPSNHGTGERRVSVLPVRNKTRIQSTTFKQVFV